MDAFLASLHHLAAFALVGLLVAELVLLGGRLDRDGLRRLGRVDMLYGVAAGIVIAAGIARLVFGPVPADVYFSNAFFWLKMGAFAVVAAISAYPTVMGVRWRLALRRDPSFEAGVADVRRLRRALYAELAVLPLIPVSAALMARGIGAL
jgi:putative membrane protein